MARTIYTERDIEDLARQGVRELTLTNDVYLTDLARERAERLEFKLRQPDAPANPSRSEGARLLPTEGLGASDREALVQKVKRGVIARLGEGVDAGLVESIIRRIVGQL